MEGRTITQFYTSTRCCFCWSCCNQETKDNTNSESLAEDKTIANTTFTSHSIRNPCGFTTRRSSKQKQKRIRTMSPRQMDRCRDFLSEQAHQRPSGWNEKCRAAAGKTNQDSVSIQRVQDYYDDDSNESLPP